MRKLKYMDVEFDEWSDSYDDEGHKSYWTNICPICVQKYDWLEEDVDIETGSGACCGVYGCDYSGEKEEIGTHYIDFDSAFVELNKPEGGN